MSKYAIAQMLSISKHGTVTSSSSGVLLAIIVLQSQTLTQKARTWLHETIVMESLRGQKCDGRD